MQRREEAFRKIFSSMPIFCERLSNRRLSQKRIVFWKSARAQALSLRNCFGLEARVIAIEKDPKFARALHRLQVDDRLQIHEADFLDFPIKEHLQNSPL